MVGKEKGCAEDMFASKINYKINSPKSIIELFTRCYMPSTVLIRS